MGGGEGVLFFVLSFVGKERWGVAWQGFLFSGTGEFIINLVKL